MREQLVAREPLGAADGAAIAAVWARGRVRDLEDLYITSGQSSDVEREIVAVSKRFSVLSRFTAFLAVDRREVVNPGGELRTVTQPVEAPAGWDMMDKADAKQKVSKTMIGGGGRGGPPLAQAQRRSYSMAAPGAPAQSAAPPPPPAAAAPAGPIGHMRTESGGYAPLAEEEADLSMQHTTTRSRAPSTPVMKVPAPPAMPPASNRPAQPPKPAPVAAPAKGRVQKESVEKLEAERAIGVDDAPYRARLRQIAEAIDAALAGPPAQLASALSFALLRLNEWTEDASSVGLDGLMVQVTPIAVQLALAVRDDQARTAAATEVARRLREVAGGTSPSAPTKSSRLAFWK